jgi:hypothetical protein
MSTPEGSRRRSFARHRTPVGLESHQHSLAAELRGEHLHSSGRSRERVASLAEELRAAGATRVVTYAEDRRLVSEDGDATALLVALGSDGEGDVAGLVDAVQRFDDEPGYTAAVTGGWTSDADESTSSWTISRRASSSSACRWRS